MKQPLSFLSRPKHIDDIVGHEKYLNKNGIIRKMIENNYLFSIVFYGYPGVGKTSLAIAICETLKIKYARFNASVHKKSDLESLIEQSKKTKEWFVIIIDEIHRLNKDKQDILLPYLESGEFIIFGTTTENPYFSINPAIRSRCQIIELEQISDIEIKKKLFKISSQYNLNIEEEVIDKLAKNSNGDLRSAINTIEILYNVFSNNKITLENSSSLILHSNSFNSKYGDEIHNLKSALHKSIRGSDPDAAVYYLSRLILSEDLISISRRLIACAYEDIGLANPSLPSRVFLATQAAREVGFPEANQILSMCVIEMALSPKSPSAYNAISSALDEIYKGELYKVPKHLQDNHYKSAIKLGVKGYKFPHDYKYSWVEQDYLPTQIKNKKFYIFPEHSQIEIKMNNYWKKIKNKNN